jgi:hypothetical protein
MDHRNSRGQIIVEAVVILCLLVTSLFLILSKLESVQERTWHYGITQKNPNSLQRQKFKK